jgi:hypothetical protein
MQYVRIEFPGVPLSGAANSEINGLTLGAVGSGTTIDHIQISFSGDDAFEWFGGTVNCKYLVALSTFDDDFDTDNGFSGNVQFGLSVRNPQLADSSKSNVFESDNNSSSIDGTSFTSASFYNITVVGPTKRQTLTNGGTLSSDYQYALHLRRNTKLKVYNSVFMDNKLGLYIDGATTAASAVAGGLVFSNNIIAGTTTASSDYGTNQAATFTSGIAAWYTAGGNTTQASSDGLLTKAYDSDALIYTGLDYRPAAVSAPSVTSATVSYSVGDVATPLSATAASGNTLNWYTMATGGTASTTAPTPATTTEGITTYYVSQTSAAMAVESARTLITVNVIPAAPTASSQTFCAGATVASLTATGTAIKWYATNEATTALTTTTALSSGTYYVSQTVNGAESTRTAVSVTVNPLTTTGSVTTSICAGDSYTWPANGITYTTAQTGVTVVSDCNTATLNLTIQAAPNAGTNGVIYLNPGVTPTNTQLFAGLSGNPTVGGTWSNVGKVYTYTVAATSPCTVDATATVTVSESIPAALSFCKGATVASAVLDSSLKFYTAATKGSLLAGTTVLATRTLYATQTVGGIESSPRSAVAITVYDLPTTPTPLVLTEGATVIKKVGNFIGTSTELTLTATAAGTVVTDHYNWVLPSGVNQTGGGSTGVITVNFDDVTPGITSLDFLVSSVSVNGCVSKTAKKLTVTRSLPGAPKGLIITDAELPAVLKITKLDAYTGILKDRTLTLTATPNTTAGSQASSYKWVLPAGVTTTATATADANTYTSSSNVINITLGNYTNETSFLFKVYGVNSNGISALTKDLTCTSAAPKTPGAITTPTLTKPTYNTTCNNSVTVQVPSVLGVSYAWSVDGGAVIESGQGSNSIVINTANASATLTISVTASNGNGPSLSKTLLLKKATSCAKIASDEVVAEEQLNVIAYPNPSSDVFTIETSAKGAINVNVYDMQGRLVEKSTSTQVGSNLAKGIYNVIVSQGAKIKSVRVIKN